MTDRCDLRCFYCIPKGFKGFTESENRLTLSEFMRVIRIFSELGVSKLRLTGGEPLVRKDIGEMVRGIAALPGVEDFSMSTNATNLAEHAAMLKESGIGRINVSLDTLKPDVFKEITQGDLAKVIDGLMAAKAADLHPIKINMVVMKDLNFDEIGDMVDFCLEHRFTLRFIETDAGGCGGAGCKRSLHQPRRGAQEA